VDEYIAAIIGAASGLILVTVALLSVAIRVGRLLEAVSRVEKDNRDRWAEWSRIWRDRCTAVDRRFGVLEQRLDRASRGVIEGDD
jgi:hypothetical protein